MTDSEQDAAVAKALGWKIEIAPTGGYYVLRHPNGTLGTDHYILKENAFKRIPKYGYDLNACHEMETRLWAQAENNEFGKYSRILEGIVISAWNLDHDTIRSAISAKPFQRREAFLRALGLWTS